LRLTRCSKVLTLSVTIRKLNYVRLARRVLLTLSGGQPVLPHDALQLRSWALTPEDAMLSLEEIAVRILNQEPVPDSGTQI
jgi:hypothetical protein